MFLSSVLLHKRRSHFCAITRSGGVLMNKAIIVLTGALLCMSGTAQARRIGLLECEEKTKVCTINANGGGYTDQFLATAKRIRAAGYRLRINGPCASACVLLADTLRNLTCITPRARFGFHMANVLGSNAEAVPKYSSDIQAWVKRNGGYPSNKSGDLRWMKYKDARKFWKAC